MFGEMLAAQFVGVGLLFLFLWSLVRRYERRTDAYVAAIIREREEQAARPVVIPPPLDDDFEDDEEPEEVATPAPAAGA